jgi:hypothetical protein
VPIVVWKQAINALIRVTVGRHRNCAESISFSPLPSQTRSRRHAFSWSTEHSTVKSAAKGNVVDPCELLNLHDGSCQACMRSWTLTGSSADGGVLPQRHNQQVAAAAEDQHTETGLARQQLVQRAITAIHVLTQRGPQMMLPWVSFHGNRQAKQLRT